MGTRSYIAYKKPGERFINGVYCHWDGYITGNGKLLHEHYSTIEKIEKLVALGDMSSLKPTIGVKHDFAKPADGDGTTFYNRDRGEEWEHVKPGRYVSLAKLLETEEKRGVEYVYLFKNGSWQVAGRGLQFFGGSDGSGFTDFVPLAGVIPLSDAAMEDYRTANAARKTGDKPVYSVGDDEIIARYAKKLYEDEIGRRAVEAYKKTLRPVKTPAKKSAKAPKARPSNRAPAASMRKRTR